MMSKQMKESFKRMKIKDELLLAQDFTDKVCHILCEDGSVFHLKNSFYIQDPENPDYIWVFCEHYECMVFCIEELIEYKNYEL